MRAILLRIAGADVSLYLGVYHFVFRAPGSAKWGMRKNETSAMGQLTHRFDQILASITDSLRKFFGVNGGDFASQRMCPSCGLITPRRKACCLECGKSLQPA